LAMARLPRLRAKPLSASRVLSPGPAPRA